MSKESKNKKRLEPAPKQKPRAAASGLTRDLTPEEKARIIRDRLASRPIIVFRYSNGRLNKRFIFTLSLLVVAMVVALYFLSRI